MKEELVEKVNEIKEAIKDKDEATVVLNKVSEIINIFADKLLEVSERQNKLEEKVEDVFDVLSQIEEEMIENLNNEFEAECPYCGETIPFRIPEEGEEFECPKCGNIIEMELLFGDDECCDGDCESHHCHGCGHVDDCDDDCDCDCDDCDGEDEE